MSTTLQRLVDRARDAHQGAAQRIEPLLGPLFARAAEGSRTLEEIDFEVGAPARMPAASSTTLNHRARRPPPTSRADSSGNPKLEGAAPLPRDVPPPLPESRVAVEEDKRVTEYPTPELLPHAVKNPVREEATRMDAPHQASRRGPPGPIQPANPMAPAQSQRELTAPAKPSRDFMAPIELTPAITISIGHVEVRNAPTPAPATQRRPSFRAGVSLKTFLQRDKGNGP